MLRGNGDAEEAFYFLFFLQEIGQFQKIVGGLIELVDQLAKEAENEKMKVGEHVPTPACPVLSPGSSGNDDLMARFWSS